MALVENKKEIILLLEQAIEICELAEADFAIDYQHVYRLLVLDLLRAKKGTLTKENFNFPNGDIEPDGGDDDELTALVESVDNLL